MCAYQNEVCACCQYTGDESAPYATLYICKLHPSSNLFSNYFYLFFYTDAVSRHMVQHINSAYNGNAYTYSRSIFHSLHKDTTPGSCESVMRIHTAHIICVASALSTSSAPAAHTATEPSPGSYHLQHTLPVLSFFFCFCYLQPRITGINGRAYSASDT